MVSAVTDRTITRPMSVCLTHLSMESNTKNRASMINIAHDKMRPAVSIKVDSICVSMSEFFNVGVIFNPLFLLRL
jgi:hypothetical protein